MAVEELHQILKAVPLAMQHTMWFMYYGALPHVTCNLKEFVDSHYSLMG